MIGLYAYNKQTDIHPWCISGGGISATIFVFSYYFGYVKPTKDSLPADSGVLGFILPIVVTMTLETMRRVMGGDQATTRNSNGSDGKTLEDMPHGEKYNCSILVVHSGIFPNFIGLTIIP